jgi:hypothetical protein
MVSISRLDIIQTKEISDEKEINKKECLNACL